MSYLERNDERQSEHLPGADNLLGSISKFLRILCKMLSQCISVPKKQEAQMTSVLLGAQPR